MTDVAELAEKLAHKTVYSRQMRKTAEPQATGSLPPWLSSSLIGAAIGGGGTGLVSHLMGRDDRVLRDAALGGLVGGAGGAAYELIPSLYKDVRGSMAKQEGTTWMDRLKGIWKGTPTSFSSSPGLTAGTAAVGTFGGMKAQQIAENAVLARAHSESLKTNLTSDLMPDMPGEPELPTSGKQTKTYQRAVDKWQKDLKRYHEVDLPRAQDAIKRQHAVGMKLYKAPIRQGLLRGMTTPRAKAGGRGAAAMLAIQALMSAALAKPTDPYHPGAQP